MISNLRLGIILIITLALTACQAPSADHEEAIRALNEAYTSGWKLDGAAAQQAAVMPLFTNDAVIIPSGGNYLLDGHDAIKGFWFPEGPDTNVILFDHEISDISVTGKTATIHGLSKLDFEYAGTRKYQEAYFVGVAKQSASGKWQFTHFTWTDHPKKTADNPKSENSEKQDEKVFAAAAKTLIDHQAGEWNARWDWYGADGEIIGVVNGTETFEPMNDDMSQLVTNIIPEWNQTSKAMLSYNPAEQKIIFISMGAKGDYWVMKQDPVTGLMLSEPHANPDGTSSLLRFTTLRQTDDAMDIQMEISHDDGENWTLGFRQYLTRVN